MIAKKKPRSCKNCHLYEDRKCYLNFPIKHAESFPYLGSPIGACYKVTSTKDYITIIRNKEIYEYLDFNDV